jgi:hypothetical protein
MFEPDPLGAPARRVVLIYLVMPVAVFVYAAAKPGMTGSLLKQEAPFTESLILAQDERWRRA